MVLSVGISHKYNFIVSIQECWIFTWAFLNIQTWLIQTETYTYSDSHTEEYAK